MYGIYLNQLKSIVETLYNRALLNQIQELDHQVKKPCSSPHVQEKALIQFMLRRIEELLFA